jgi:hypothetical protein
VQAKRIRRGKIVGSGDTRSQPPTQPIKRQFVDDD